MNNKILLIKYQENFADNLSNYANARIIAENEGYKCYYENISKFRNNFEKMMSCFNLKCNYISQNRAKEITHNVSKHSKLKTNKNFSLDLSYFKIDDIHKISQELMSEFYFSEENFLYNYDILEEIKKTNSIGLYLSKKDSINVDYINKAIKRLNKYVKQPKLFVFTSNKSLNKTTFDIETKIIVLDSSKEEFFLLSSCKHKIIHNTTNSYSEGFWAAVLNQKEYFYNIYDKKIKVKNKKHNWIAV